MANPTFDLTATASRGKFIAYVDVSEQTGDWDPAEAEWEPQGYGTEDSTLDYSPTTTSFTDILEIQHNQIEELTLTQDVAPNSIRPAGQHGKLNPILLEYTRRKMLTKLTNFKVMYVYWFTTTHEAEVYTASSIVPQSIGGGSTVDFPYQIMPGGEIIYGTADKGTSTSTTAKVTFTPEV